MDMNYPGFCTTVRERVYITALGWTHTLPLFFPPNPEPERVNGSSKE
jgi:hypothetical protein